MGVQAASMLVELSISVWTAQKLDKGATRKVVSDNNTADNAVQVRKNLMSGTDLRKRVADHAAQVRGWHNQRTLPWANNGQRLLPTKLFFDYKKEINRMEREFWDLVDAFVDAYPTLVSQAQRELGNLYDPDDYPPASAVRSKFAFKCVFSPVPDSNDFRLDVAREDLEALRAQYETAFTDRLAESMRESWTRLHGVLTHMSERLTDTEEGKKIFRNTLLENARELCGLLKGFNVTNDPTLELARQQLEAALTGADIDVLRDSTNARAVLKKKVDDILKQFEF